MLRGEKRGEDGGHSAVSLAGGEPQFAADYVICWLSDENLGYVAALTADVDAVGGINYALALQVVEFHGRIGIVLVQVDAIDAGYEAAQKQFLQKKWGTVMVAFKVVRGVKGLKDIKVRSELPHALSGWCLDVAEG